MRRTGEDEVDEDLRLWKWTITSCRDVKEMSLSNAEVVQSILVKGLDAYLGVT